MALIPRKKAKGGRQVERFTLSAAQVSSKSITLAETPEDSNSVVIDCPNGPIQRIDVDYIVTGSIISWDGYGLETILNTGDHLIVTY